MRYGHVLATMTKAGSNVLVCGAVGVGKTSIVASTLSGALDDILTL